MKQLKGAVVVITGASSGIGHAAAHAFAKRGSIVVLAARRQPVLEEVAAACSEAGATDTMAHAVDVTDPKAMATLASTVYQKFGRLDVWVNNAAVSLFSRFEEAPLETYRQVIDTNLFGYIHGARAALPYFREQGSGTLINVGSVVSSAPQPYTSAYVASKSAINSLTDSLRMELSLDKAPGINICMILPASIDTPIFQNAANYSGRQAQPLKPVYRPERVASAIVAVARQPRRKTLVGEAGQLFVLGHALLPRAYEVIGARLVENNHLKQEIAMPDNGNTFKPSSNTGISGGWREPKGRSTGMKVGIAAAIAVAAGIGLVMLMKRRTSKAGK